MSGLFIAGTDTGVGKTLITGCLARLLMENGEKVITQKWVQTGSAGPFDSDVAVHARLMGMPLSRFPEFLDHRVPYCFRYACSPHLACRMEKRRISVERIKKSYQYLSSLFDRVIVEGTGGILVPIDQKTTILELAVDLKLKVVLVVQNRLGCINHTLLTIEALKRRKVEILGIIFNNLKGQDIRILRDNPVLIMSITRQRILGVIPYVFPKSKIYPHFLPIGTKLINYL